MAIAAKPRSMEDLDRFLSVDDVQEKLAQIGIIVTKKSVYNYLERNRVPRIRVGRNKFIKESDLVASIAAQS